MKQFVFRVATIGFISVQALFGAMVEYGYDVYEEVAKQKALENLGKKLELEAKKRGYDKFLYAFDKLPILKPIYSINTVSKGFEAKIKLDDSSLKSYYKRIEDIKQDMHYLKDTLAFIKTGRLHLEMLEDLYSIYSKLERYYAVLNIVYGQTYRFFTKEKTKMQKEFFTLKTDIDSPSYAIDLLNGFFRQRLTFIYPLTVFGSQTPSLYGIEFAKKLFDKVNPVSDIDLAKYFIVGRYAYKKHKVLIQLALLDRAEYDIIHLKTLLYRDKKLKEEKMLPKNRKIEPSLFSGYKKNDFDLFIKSAKGSSDLTFEEKKRTEFYLKSKAKGYLFVIGYYSFPKKTLVYLAQLSSKIGKAKFIKRIKKTKGYVKIADFVIKPPFATRSYQLFVTDKKPKLPKTTYNKKYHVYEIKTKNFARFVDEIKKKQRTSKRYKKVSYAAISFVTLKAEE